MAQLLIVNWLVIGWLLVVNWLVIGTNNLWSFSLHSVSFSKRCFQLQSNKHVGCFSLILLWRKKEKFVIIINGLKLHAAPLRIKIKKSSPLSLKITAVWFTVTAVKNLFSRLSFGLKRSRHVTGKLSEHLTSDWLTLLSSLRWRGRMFLCNCTDWTVLTAAKLTRENKLWLSFCSSSQQRHCVSCSLVSAHQTELLSKLLVH